MTWPVEEIEAGFDVGVFGGWAKELLGLADGRPHGDVDLMVVDSDMDALNAYIAGH